MDFLCSVIWVCGVIISFFLVWGIAATVIWMGVMVALVMTAKKEMEHQYQHLNWTGK